MEKINLTTVTKAQLEKLLKIMISKWNGKILEEDSAKGKKVLVGIFDGKENNYGLKFWSWFDFFHNYCQALGFNTRIVPHDFFTSFKG